VQPCATATAATADQVGLVENQLQVEALAALAA